MEGQWARRMLSIPHDLEEEIKEIKKTPEFCMKPISEVIRYLMRLGVEKMNEKQGA